MVDINLIGDDRTGEEERVDDFTQTSSMDTQELAFEERTETFDTTKTAGFTPKRSYSPIISILIILAVVGLLGGSIYFFLYSGDNTESALDIPTFETPDGEESFATNNEDAELDRLSQEFSEDLSDLDGQEQQATFNDPEPFTDPASQPVQQPAVTRQPARDTQPAASPPVSTRDLSPTVSDFASNSSAAVQAVTGLLTSMPTNLSTTLLSYAGRHVRLEFVAATAAEATDFTDRLNQYIGSGNFAVVSKNQVSSNRGVLEKVLISGTMTSSAPALSGGQIRFMNIGQAGDWVRRSAQQFGLTVRQVSPQQSSYTAGFQRTPILVRLGGSKSAIVGFLQDLSNQSYNVDLSKILLVSPDVVTYSDDNLVLVLNIFLYEQR